MTPDELREAVAGRLAEAQGEIVNDAWRFYLDDADAAIALIRPAVLEEAARVAGFRVGATEWSAETNSGYECAAREIAAAIRALKEKA